MMHKILLVEDQQDIVDSFKTALKRERFSILTARSVHEARVVLATQQVVAIALSDQVPGVELDYLEELARTQPTVPRVILSATPSVELAIRCINQGQVFKFLVRPFERETLCDTLRDALHKHVTTALTDRVVHLARRQVMVLEDLEREMGASHDAPAVVFSSPLSSTQEVPAIAGADIEMPEDPISYLTPQEAAKLSRRERELLRAVVAGKKPRDLAGMFFISVHTARNHIKAIYRKLGVHAQGELIAKVLRAPGRGMYSAG
jgi:DNA-binding NarL/FixJ family response regulator